MALSAPSFPPFPAEPSPDPRARILIEARRLLLVHGYTRFTMADLATELGMSKKTLYLYFRSKHAIVGAVIEDMAAEIRRDAEAVLRDRRLNLAEKLRGFLGGMMERFAELNPAKLRDLQRFAPDLHRRIEEMRNRNIPYIFGRFIEEGQASGAVRDDINAAFAVEFYLHAVQNLMQPDAQRRLHLTPPEVLQSALDLFFRGLLTSTGRKDHEKLFVR
ncbi:MAG TPA: TetR/AcrR family transcriptional regulator [Opitutaceae bacterium]|nr:TetR/AcrR family transcriptional regulator [Opitutaceae bacterium]